MKKILNSLKDKLLLIKNNLTKINEKETLSRFSIIVIVFLDLFILYAIFAGLGEHTNQLTSPDEYIPGICREIIIEDTWSETTLIDNLSGILRPSYTNYDEDEEIVSQKNQYPACSECTAEIRKLHKNKDLLLLFKSHKKLKEELADLKESIDELKSSYDSYLLGKIAKESSLNKSDVVKIKDELNKKTISYNNTLGQLNTISLEISTNAGIRSFWNKISVLQINNRKGLAEEYKNREFWFPVKKLLMEMIFLLPLLILFYFWNSISIKKFNGLQTLISSHLLIVTFIPVFIKIIETVYDIIPKKLLKALWDLLVDLNLIAIWHYVIILISIIVSLLLIYVIQKKLFNRDRLIERRISRGECLECGKKIPSNINACPFCGFKQNTTCTSCGEATYVYGKFCKSCGSAIILKNNTNAF